MAEIKLSRGYVAIVDDADLPLLAGYTWWANVKVGHVTAYTTVRRKTLLMHRLIVGALVGSQVDHRNRNSLDNRRANLRICTGSQNSANMMARGESGFRGVNIIRSKYCATKYQGAVYPAGKPPIRGPLRFEPIEAARDYDALANVTHGEFASLNFPAERGT